MEATDCSVCCEQFNKLANVKISCEHNGVCSFDACKTCVKTYLLGTTSDPNCMQCNKGWSDKFIAANLGSTFLRSEYSIHRKELLVQQQISRMPETMAAAETYKQIELMEKQVDTLKLEHKNVGQRRRELSSKIHDMMRVCVDYTTVSPERKAMNMELNDCLTTMGILSENIRHIKHNIAVLKHGGTVAGEEKTEARKFIMPCPNADCRGYLSSKYKCELCEYHTCAKCFELIGLSKDDDANPHTCKPENVESAEFIKKQSKPCPCCGTRISKIDGCDQMWCTQCHKAFSWNTGKIVTGAIHNPHFYQYQRENGGGAMARNPGDVVCGGLPNVRDIQVKLTQGKIPKDNQKIAFTLMEIHRLQLHFMDFTVTPLRNIMREEQNFELERILYILKKISREELASKIIRKDNARKKQTAVLHVCELFTTVAIDMFQKILLSENVGLALAAEIEARIGEYTNLREYCNEHFKEISMLYNVCVPYISANWTSESSKFNAKGDVDKYIEKRDAARKVKKDLADQQYAEYRKMQEERMVEYRLQQAAMLEQRSRV